MADHLDNLMSPDKFMFTRKSTAYGTDARLTATFVYKIDFSKSNKGG